MNNELRVLVINEGCSPNLGDQAIRYCLENLLLNEDCQVDFQFFSGKNVAPTALVTQQKTEKNNNESFVAKCLKKLVPQRLTWLKWLWRNRRMYTQFFQKNKQYDLVLIGGGQLLLANGHFPAALFLWVNLWKRWRQTKTVLVGVGAGTTFGWQDSFFIRQALHLSDAVYVRDRKSQIVLQEKFHYSSQFIPDVAFSIADYFPKKINLAKAEKPILLVLPIGYSVYLRYFKASESNKKISEIAYIKSWLEVVCRYIGQGFAVQFSYTALGQDVAITQQLVASLSQKYQYDASVLAPTSLKHLCELIQKVDIVFSGRMHALILALAYEKKVISYNISPKLQVFEQEYIQTQVDLMATKQQIKQKIREILC